MTTHAVMRVMGVRIERTTHQPVVLLHEESGARYVPIWVGATEAAAIAFALQGSATGRPLTHALIVTLMDAVGHSIQQVRIHDLVDGVFFATVVLSGGQEVDSRSSDAIAVALRADVPIVMSTELLHRVGVVIPEDIEQDVSEFREFLARVDPEDFRDDSA